MVTAKQKPLELYVYAIEDGNAIDIVDSYVCKNTIESVTESAKDSIVDNDVETIYIYKLVLVGKVVNTPSFVAA